ncbi:MAG: allophanate hydrolase, partial [Reinekea sp.]|nr:allophanate hydrolase [Reinekea sp.]
VPGYQWADITEQEQQKILTGEFFVGKQNDRMGYRLEGEKINTRLPQLTSEGICTGAIQITGDGDPIILMRDRQTIGGYPKIGSVISSSLDTLAQLTQGARIRFEIINAEQSVQQYRQYCHDMEQRPLQTLHY